MGYPAKLPVRFFKQGEYAVINGKKYALERTCRNIFPQDGILPNHPETMFRCSECGCDVQDYESYGISMVGNWNYCPNCGAKVIG